MSVSGSLCILSRCFLHLPSCKSKLYAITVIVNLPVQESACRENVETARQDSCRGNCDAETNRFTLSCSTENKLKSEANASE